MCTLLFPLGRLRVLDRLIEQEGHRNQSPVPEAGSDGVNVWNPPSTQGMVPENADNGLFLFMVNQKNVCPATSLSVSGNAPVRHFVGHVP